MPKRFGTTASVNYAGRHTSTGCITILLLFFLPVTAIGIRHCDAAEEAAPATLSVYTGIAPLAFCAERIGGQYVAVSVLLPAGQDPHLYAPGPQQLIGLGNARLYLLAGLPFERRLIEKLRGRQKNITIIDTGESVTFLNMQPAHEHGAHTAGHELRDPHFWLGAPQLIQMIPRIIRALADADPAHAAAYRQNGSRLIAEVQDVHARNRTLLAPYRGRIFFVYHPAFGYFAAAYGLLQQAVELEGKRPSPRQVTNMIKAARSRDVKALFVQPQFDSKSAATIAGAIGGSVVPLDPLAKNILKNMQTMAETVAQSFANSAPMQKR